MTGGRRNLVLITVFWGDWHRGTLLDANLPTILAPGNLPALLADVDCEYLIYTTVEDARQMLRNRAFQRLQEMMPVSVRLFTPLMTQNIYSLHHEIWLQGVEYARLRGAFVLLMPPDVAWADGSLAQLSAALEAGKRVTFMAYPRVASETIIPTMIDRFPKNADEAMVIAPREMMELAIAHLHPLMAAHGRSSPHFTPHPELILWPIEGDGFLLRLLARELFCFEPGRVLLNAQAQLARLPPQDEICVFQDSQKFLALSFAPLSKDVEWYCSRLDPIFVGRWWNVYDSPLNDHLSALDFRFTTGSGDEAQWRHASQAAANLMAHLRSAREFIRIVLKLQKMNHTRAAAFLASAISEHGLARRWPHRGPFLILAPTDEAFDRNGLEQIPPGRRGAAQVRRLVERHAAPLPKRAHIKDGKEVTTLAGQRIHLENALLAQSCGENVIVPWRAALRRKR